MESIVVMPVRPPGYVHAAGLDELAETVHCGLKALGRTGSQRFWFGGEWGETLSKYNFSALVVGGHLLTGDQVSRVPENAIIYNTEQFGSVYSMITPAYRDLLRTHQVWDVNPGPYDYVSKHRIKYVPVGYVPEMTRIETAEVQDIDVLFYGSMSDRRHVILDKLRARGLNVIQLFGVYGAERDAHIARAKVVLSMHYAAGGQFEQVRVAYLLANSKAVVCEGNEGSARSFLEAEMSLPYTRLVETCEWLASSPSRREVWETVGFDTVAKLKETDILRAALDLPA